MKAGFIEIFLAIFVLLVAMFNPIWAVAFSVGILIVFGIMKLSNKGTSEHGMRSILRLIFGIVLFFIFIGFVSATYILVSNRNNTDNSERDNEPVACTLEAKMCPDGSYVGRVGPNCEFAKCPVVSDDTSTGGDVVVGRGGVKGKVLLGPNCPVIQDGQDCPDKPYSTTLIVTTSDGVEVVGQVVSDQKGEFSMPLPVGEYSVRREDSPNPFPFCGTDVFRVTSNTYTEILVTCDTGIR